MQYRVIGRTRQVPVRGYIEPETRTYNILQRKLGPFWISVDKEEVPSDVILAKGTCGSDNGGWKSRFSAFMN